MKILDFIKKRYKLLFFSFGGTLIFRFLLDKFFNESFSLLSSLASGGVLFFILLKDPKNK